MASIKVKFRPSSVATQEGSIYYQVLHDRKPRQLLSGCHVFPDEWNEKRSTVQIGDSKERTPLLLSVREQIRRDTERLTRIIRKLDDAGLSYTSDEVIEEFHKQLREHTLFNYMETLISKLKLQGRQRTSETYASTLNSFRKFRDQEEMMLDEITTDIMEAYQTWLRQRGVTANTTSFYLRILRAVYNRAVEDGLTQDRSPFRRVYTGVDKTVKRALPLQYIKKIKALDLSRNPPLQYARDMFILSFMLRGMSFIDMAYLKKSELQNGYIRYRRRKTGQQLTVQWTEEMQSILDRYPKSPTQYLFPILKNSEPDERRAYHNASYRINHNLKHIAAMLDIPGPLTLYVARHSWASAAKAKGIPLSVISEGMGHDSESTTRIYLATLDTSAVDNANSLIIGDI